MNRWILSIGVALIGSAASAQITEGAAFSETYQLHGYRIKGQTWDVVGPVTSFYGEQGSFDRTTTETNVSLNFEDIALSIGSMTWAVHSDVDAESKITHVSATSQLLDFSFSPTPGFTITADSIESTADAFLPGAEGSTQFTGLTIDAFGDVTHFNGPIAPNTTIWNGNGFVITANMQEIEPDYPVPWAYVVPLTVDGFNAPTASYDFFGVTSAQISTFDAPPVPEPSPALAMAVPFLGLGVRGLKHKLRANKKAGKNCPR